jgi:signal transduction histidine kinase
VFDEGADRQAEKRFRSYPKFLYIKDDIIPDAKRAGDVVRKVRSVVTGSDAQLSLAPDLADIRGDRVRLQQVLLNLVTDAVDAMKEKTSSVGVLDSPGVWESALFYLAVSTLSFAPFAH